VLDRACRLPAMNRLTVTHTADLVAGDIVTGVIKTVEPDGTEIEITISETYASSNVATMGAIVTDLEAADTDIDAALSGSNRILTITVGGDKRIVVVDAFDIDNTGSGTATSASVKSSTDTLLGIVERDENAVAALGTTYTAPVLEAGQMVAVVQSGDPAVVMNNASSVGGTAYALTEDYTDQASVLNRRGTFRSNTDGGLAPLLTLSSAEVSGTRDNGLAPVTVNKP